MIRSFILVPVSGSPALRHQPGQHLRFLFNLPGHGVLKRNYSISCAPNDRAYRITVKREGRADEPAGIVSNWLHDHARYGTVLRAAPPAGDFFLDQASNAPVVLVSGGVGLTPMMSMLETITAATPERSTWYVHGALNGCVHAMRDHAKTLTAGNKNVRLHTFYAEPEAQDRQGEHYDAYARKVADAILSASADAVIASDREGIIRVWNAGAERIFGYTSDEAFGQSLDIIRPERLRKRHWEGYRKTMATGESRYGEGALLSVPGVCMDGRQISLELTIAPLKDEQGAMTGMVTVMRDVTIRFTELKVLKQRLAEATEGRAGPP